MTWPSLRDVLATNDQGLLRLQLSLRGTLSVFLTTLAAVAAAHVGQFSPVECASGITFSMMAPFLMREPTRRQRQSTLLFLLLPAMGATVATTLLHGYGILGDSLFLVLVFLCFLLGPRSPRGIGMGLIAVITTYVGLYLELPRSTLPLQLASQVIAVPIIALACFVIVPMDAAATLRRSIAAVQARAAQVIRQARMLDATDHAAARRLRRAVMRLNESALAADDQLAFFEPGAAGTVRSRLVDVELWASRLTNQIQITPPTRRLAARLRLHARRIERGGRYSTAPGQYETGTLLSVLVGLGQAVYALGRAVDDQRMAPPAAPQAPVRGPLAWRLATRVTIAAALAMAGGMALSPQRWFWAVITVYVVFLNVRSRGETIYKGVQRLIGTIFGIASGLVIATAFSGDGTLETITLLLSIFGMYYTFLSSYTLGIFFVTVMLGLLYGMLGAPLEAVLVLRLEETAIGAAAAIFVAAFILPEPTRVQIRRSGQSVLAALAAAMRASAQTLQGDKSAAPTISMRQVDRSVADLKLALAPLTATRMIMRRPTIERPLSALLDCVNWARVVAAEAHTLADAAPIDRLMEAARRFDALASGADVAPHPPPPDGTADPLAQLERAITTMEERRTLGAHEVYAIDS